MKNLAGIEAKIATEQAAAELQTAGIPVAEKVPPPGNEVQAAAVGELHGWTFYRRWYYWSAYGPDLPFAFSLPLDERMGKEVRAAGDCGCSGVEYWFGAERHKREIEEWNSPESQRLIKKLGLDPTCPPAPKGCNLYHIDTQDGLKALADAIRAWAASEVYP